MTFVLTYTRITQLLLCMPYLLRYGDIEFGSHFEIWPSPRYAQFLKIPPSRILKPYVYIIQINSETSLSTKCLRAYRARSGLKRTENGRETDAKKTEIAMGDCVKSDLERVGVEWENI